MYKTIHEQELRPARNQVGEEVLRDLGALRGEMEAGSTYNIWYNKWTGHRNSFRGCCPHGSNCRFWHRIPCPEDREEIPVDLFGRERHMNFRDDMGGAGAFGRENKVLYVGRVAPYPDMEEVIRRYFSPFGEIAKARALSSLNIPKGFTQNFPKKSWQIKNSKEKRWATEDPNPGSKEEFQQLSEQMVYQVLTKDLPAEYSSKEDNHEEQVIENPNKKIRLEASDLDNSNSAAISNESPVVTETPNKPQAQNSLISIDVLQTLGYMSQHINNAKAYLNQNLSKPSAPSKVSDEVAVSLLGDAYDSE